jgi:hypothetical protein
MTKPNNISWMCQVSGSKRLGKLLPLASMTIHTNRASADHTPAAKKTALKPWVRKSGWLAVPWRSARLICRFHRLPFGLRKAERVRPKFGQIDLCIGTGAQLGSDALSARRSRAALRHRSGMTAIRVAAGLAP